jgi:hypothetical protein
MCRVGRPWSSGGARLWVRARRRLASTKDIAVHGAEIAYYPLLILGIMMILFAN